MAKRITRDDIMPMEEYAAIRRDKAREIAEIKRHRRLEVGPHATLYFESYDTMWRQIHEMLFVEKGGEVQIADELAAYNPLIPRGRELLATLMFEIEDPARRRRILGQLGGVEETVFIKLGEETIRGEAERDVDRSTDEGKASSVHFLHFPFSDEQVRRFREGAEVIVGIGHAGYSHMAGVPETVREALVGDFD